MLYITYYTTPDDKRKSSPAANAKALSISKALAANGIDVTLLSTCTVAKSGKLIKGRRFEVSKGVTCKQYSLFNTGFGPLRRLQYYIANARVFLTLLFKAKKNEDVLFYHAIERSFPILLAKKIKKFRLVLEVEEVYANAGPLPRGYVEAEQKCLKSADAYIFPTESLSDIVNTENKPYCIIHGTYETEPVLAEPEKDRTHVVYAGTLNALKGGAGFAVDAAEFLDEKYHIHILGFGSEQQIADIKKRIAEVSEKTACQVSYDGCLFGDEYSKAVQKCSIGLSTQNPDAVYNDTSFPSKILSYMANGLKVVTVRIPVVQTSAVNDYMYYYDEPTAKNIAEAIKNAANCGSVDAREIIKKLNLDFTNEINKVFICK